MTLRRDDEAGRFELLHGDQVVAVADFHLHDGATVITRTEVADGHQGEGLGSELAEAAVADIRAAGGRLVPLCPFVARWIDEHPEQADLVDHELTVELSR